MRIDRLEARRLRERFIGRARTVFYCRLPFYVLATAILFNPLPLCLLAIAYAAHRVVADDTWGRWGTFASLCADLVLLALLLPDNSGMLSPAMLVQPLYSMFFTLLFPNPLVALPALLLLPYGIFCSASLGPTISLSSELIYLGMYGCLNAGIMYLMNCSIATEEEQTREVVNLERRLRSLSVAEERHRLAREIHDGVGAALSGLVIQSEYLLMLASPKTPLHTELGELKLTAEDAIDEVRRAISMMRQDFDLTYQLQNACKLFESRHKIPAHLTIEGIVPELSPEAQLTLFRIMQESLTNIAKHAHASFATVNVQFRGAGYTLTVRDNGHGFDMHHVPPAHYGLISMNERAKKIGAVVTIASQLDKGTTVELAFGN